MSAEIRSEITLGVSVHCIVTTKSNAHVSVIGTLGDPAVADVQHPQGRVHGHLHSTVFRTEGDTTMY